MSGIFERIIADITPSSVLGRAKEVLRSKKQKPAASDSNGEKNSEWYDASFNDNDQWRIHYSGSEYYFLWAVIADRIIREKVKSVLEIGCGPGQLACLLRDKRIPAYHGFDFSSKRIEQARRVCPEFTFSLQDVFQTDLFTTLVYDAVICTEFLEHVDRDIDVLRRIKSGTKFYGTVPNFPFTSHVRYFVSADEVISRYQPCFSELRIDMFIANAYDKKFFLLEGSIA